jgi:hypothetical protein
MSKQVIAHINLFVNDKYLLTFGYPANVPKAMNVLTERLTKTAEHTTDVSQSLGTLIQHTLEDLPDDLTTMSMEEQSQFVFLLCGFLKQLCEEANDHLEAGNQYHLKLIIEDDGMVAEMYDVQTLH